MLVRLWQGQTGYGLVGGFAGVDRLRALPRKDEAFELRKSLQEGIQTQYTAHKEAVEKLNFLEHGEPTGPAIGEKSEPA